MDFMTVTRLRFDEAVESYNLVIKLGQEDKPARADAAVLSSRSTVVILNLHPELTTFNFQTSICQNQPDSRS